MSGVATVDTPAVAVRMQRYLLCFALGAALTFLCLAGGLIGLKAAGALPPPQISNSLCIDEKLNAMRSHPPQAPRLLVVGSSVAWRHFNSAEAVKIDPLIRPYNAGFCGAKISQTARVASWLSNRLPTVRHVVLVASPFDFETCRGDETSQFDIKDADRFVFGKGSAALFYARYFDPVTLISNARGIRENRASSASLNPLVQNIWGDGPSEPPASRGLHYGSVRELDDSCFASLHEMAVGLEAQGIAFDVALMPMQLEWNRLFGEPRLLHELEGKAKGALAGTQARLHVSFIRMPQTAYFDAMHLRWSSTPAFTRAVLREVGASPRLPASVRR